MTPGRVRRLMRDRGTVDAVDLKERIRLLERTLELEEKVNEAWTDDDELRKHLQLLSAVEEAETEN